MPLTINAVLSPHEPLPEADAWLVIDILRATTMILTFFELGGRTLIPVADLEGARALKRRLGTQWLLMGERGALKPEGFDFGNSPLELRANWPGDRPEAILTTTNGALALELAAATGKPVYALCARNRLAAIKAARREGERIGIFCAGRDGRAAVDDAACAALAIDSMMAHETDTHLNDAALLAQGILSHFKGDFLHAVSAAGHAKKLLALGLSEDIRYCTEIDTSSLVPRLGVHSASGRPAFVGSPVNAPD
ncbi:MAG: 2-phosphosulfolactate phosphatase [Myxococcales bacterium]|nr:MAG: 2-phosphosulfolactate phosphatase [Myxococcales bacterium]